MNISRERLATLKALRPSTALDETWPAEDRDARLRWVLTHESGSLPTPGQQSGRRPHAPLRRRLILAGAAAAVLSAAVAAVPMLNTGVSYAATPAMLQFTPAAGQPSARTVLTDLARRARAQPAPPGQGRYHYIHTRDWLLNATVDENNYVNGSAIFETDRQHWVAPDGSGRVLRDFGQNLPDAVPDMMAQPGDFPGDFLPANATTSAIRAKYGESDDAVGWVRTIEGLWHEQVVPPVLQARLLDNLAAQPGVNLLGETTDRAGRRGMAVSVEDLQSPRQRFVLVLHPDTGILLDLEVIALEDSYWEVPLPATVEYTLWINTGYSASVTSTP